MPGGEETVLAERLKQMVKVGAVENYGPNGYDRGPRDDTTRYELFRMMDRATTLTGLSSPSFKDKDQGKTTQIAFVPVSGLSQEQAQPKRGGLFGRGRAEQTTAEAKWSKDDVAVCFSYQGNTLDKYSRNGMLRGMVVMSRSNAEQFQTLVQSDPRLIFVLARTVNNGPIRRFDNTPADLQPGTRAVILANSRAGGSLTANIDTQPFPAGYQANPIF